MQSRSWTCPPREAVCRSPHAGLLPYDCHPSCWNAWLKRARASYQSKSGEVYRTVEGRSSKAQHSLQGVSSRGCPLVDITLTRPLESVRGIYALQSQPHALRFDLLSMSIGHSPTFMKHEISYHSCCCSCLRDLGSSLPLEFVKRHVISGCNKNSPSVQIRQNQLSSFL